MGRIVRMFPSQDPPLNVIRKRFDSNDLWLSHSVVRLKLLCRPSSLTKLKNISWSKTIYLQEMFFVINYTRRQPSLLNSSRRRDGSSRSNSIDNKNNNNITNIIAIM